MLGGCVAAILAFNAICLALGWANVLERSFTDKVFFSIRSALGRDPVLAKNLKIFTLDDPANAYLKYKQPNHALWADIILAINKQRPRAILVDKLFDMPNSEEDLQAFKEKISSDVPLYTGAFITRQEIAERPPLAENFLKNFPDKKNSGAEKSNEADVSARSNFVAYGPDQNLTGTIKGVGHLNYEGLHTFHAFQILENGMFLPHLGLQSALRASYSSQNVYLNGERVPNTDGEYFVNIAAPSSYISQSYSLKPVVQAMRQGKAISVIEEDDVVLILPSMYTGNADWTNTPHGLVPGGYIITAITNSVMTGQWLHQFDWQLLTTLTLSLLSIFCATTLASRHFAIYIITMQVAWFGAATAAFSFGALLLPWAFPALSSAVSSIVCHIFRLHIEAVAQAAVDAELATAQMIQQTYLPKDQISKGPFSLQSVYQPANQCSGDWWYLFDLENGSSILLIGDASGHGVGPALATACVHAAAYSAMSLFDGDSIKPSDVLRVMNKALHQTFNSQISMTAFAIKLTPDSNIAQFANAGHTRPMLTRAGSISTLSNPSNPLGILAESNFHNKDLLLMPGDRLFLFTDGLTDARNRRFRRYGENKLKRFMETQSALTAKDLLILLVQEVTSFQSSKTFEDDLTALVLDVSPEWYPKVTKSA